MTRVMLLLLLAACGSSRGRARDPSTATHTDASSGSASARRKEPTPEAICGRLAGLKNDHCGAFTEMEIDPDKCPRAFRAAQDGPPSTERLALRQLGRCVVSNERCGDVEECVGAIEHFRVRPPKHAPSLALVCDRLHGPLASCGYDRIAGKDRNECASNTQYGHLLEQAGHCFVDEGDDCEHVTYCLQDATFDKTDLRACSEFDPDKAAGLLEAEWAHRKGAGMTRYSDARSSTKAMPIEVCGFLAENEWLFSATCDDGSHPITKRKEAEAARSGNEGRGGRCGSIIDLYKVKCPEATYDIHIDAYVCPLTE